MHVTSQQGTHSHYHTHIISGKCTAGPDPDGVAKSSPPVHTHAKTHKQALHTQTQVQLK